MKFYLDADLFLALIKPKDYLKEKATMFFREHKPSECVTSTMTIMEVWFYFQKNALPNAHETISAIRGLVEEVWPVHDASIEAALILSEKSKLNPADAVHAALALAAGTIVSSDKAFGRVQGLKQTRFDE